MDFLKKLAETTEIAVADQVSKAKSLGILEHSPDDEVEGEMVYLQTRLLDNAVVLKHRYGNIFSVYLFCVSFTLLPVSLRNNQTLCCLVYFNA